MSETFDSIIEDKEVADAFDPSLRRSFEVSDTVPEGIKRAADVKIRKDSILLSGDKTFYTLQGEGPTMGLPCVFARLHVCNLRCTWCDAFYTWKADSEEFWTESTRMSFEECANLIKDTWEQNASDNVPHRNRVIFSGGEPLIQKTQIDAVMDYLNPGWLEGGEDFDLAWVFGKAQWELEIETNGTLMPTTSQLEYAQFNVSPKLANSDNNEHQMVKPKVLKALDLADSTFKFVCYDERDLDEIEDKYLPHISPRRVIIMPQGIRSEEIDENMQKLYEPCMKRGYRLLGRMQSQFADGARRGV